MKRSRGFWIGLAVLVLVRVVVLFTSRPWESNTPGVGLLMGDAADYHAAALGFLRGEHPGLVALERAPLYPLALAGVYAVVGIHPWLMLPLQILMSAVLFGMIHDLTARGFGRGAVVAAWLYALEPQAIYSSVSLLTETLCTLLLVAAVLAVARGWESGRLRPFAFAGVTLALSALARPLGQFLVLPLLAVTGFRFRGTLGGAARAVLLVAVCFGATLAPWLVANQLRYGATGISTKGASHGLYWIVAYTEVQRSGRPLEEVRGGLRAEVLAAGGDPAGNPFEHARVMSRVAWRHIAQDPLAYVRSGAAGAFYCFANLGSSEFSRALGIPAASSPDDWYAGASLGQRLTRFLQVQNPASLTVFVLLLALLLTGYTGAAAGAVFALREGRIAALLAMIGLVLYFLPFIGPIAVGRYRVPFMPFYLALAGYGLASLAARFGPSRRDAGAA